MKHYALWNTLVQGYSIANTAAEIRVGEQVLRRWIRGEWQSERRCWAFGCNSPAKGSVCDYHRERGYLRYIPTNRDRFCRTAAWQRGRHWFIESHPMCGSRIDGRRHDEHSYCTYKSRNVQARVVDHIDAHLGDGSFFWDIENWQALCVSCHGQKTCRHDGGLGNLILPA